MLRRLDAAILNKLDRVTTYAQKRGILLTTVHVGAAGATLLTDIGFQMTPEPDPTGVAFALIVWGSWLFAYIKWANENKDYPESAKIMERLNAAAVHLREDQFYFRMMWMFLFSLVAILSGTNIILDIMTGKTISHMSHHVLSIIHAACPCVMWYLNGCIFLGPGHFAKDRKQSSILNAISLRG